MFLCKRLAQLDRHRTAAATTMFSRFNDVLQSAADVIAPPPTPLQDFQYHWKQVKAFYTADAASVSAPVPPSSSSATCSAFTANASASSPPPAAAAPHKCHLDDTRIPHHLDQMLQHLIAEETRCDTATTAQPCLDFLLTTRPLDLLAELAASDSPPGARVCILGWLRRYLSCMRRPRLDRPAVLQPVQRLIALCRGGRASPYETEEILFAATVAGLVRKEPFLVHLFLPAHQHTAFVRRRLHGDAGGGDGVDANRRLSTVAPHGNPLFDAHVVQSDGVGSMRKVTVAIVNGDVGVQTDAEVRVIELGAEAMTVGEVGATDPAAADVAADTEADVPFACDCDPLEDRLGLLDTILGYTDSPDTLVILRACEGALMLATLPTVAATRCAAVRASLATFAERVAGRLGDLCARIPEDMDAGDIEECTVSWGLMPRDADHASHFVGRAQLNEFLGWLDYTNCLAQEACATMAGELCRQVRRRLLEPVIEPHLLDENAAFALVLLAKIVHQLDAGQFKHELAHWLVGADEPQSEVLDAAGTATQQHRPPTIAHDCLLNILVDNASDNGDLLLPTLQFVEALIDNCNDRILHGMLFRYVNTRGYYDAAAAGEQVQTWSDEEDERARRRAETEVPTTCRSRTMAPTYILKVINNFLLLLPRQIMSAEATGTRYEEYVQDASRHYQNWVHRTASFDWPAEATFPADADADAHQASTSRSRSRSRSPSTSAAAVDRPQQSHCNDSGICEESFYEGPLLRLLFQHVRNMATHPYEFNLAVIAILSKLALLPHPHLHEILLDPEVPVARGTHTLWSSMQWLARQLLLEVPRREGFQRKVAETGRRLLTNPPMMCEPCDDSDPVFEALVVLEEFCKELAAIAFVKYHHATE